MWHAARFASRVRPFRCATLICWAACSSPCGITWAGTISRRSQAKWKRRSALTRARCSARLLLVVVSYVLPVAAIAGTGIDPNSWTTGGWVDVGPHRRRRNAGSRHRPRGSHRRHRIVRHADAFLHALAAGDGRGRLPSARVHARQRTIGHAVGRRILCCAIFWAICYPLGFETQPDSRRAAHRPQHSARILGARSAADSRTEFSATISRPRRHRGQRSPSACLRWR